MLPKGGGWLDQPLPLLAQMTAIDLTVQTFRYKAQKDFDMAKLTRTQLELMAWLEND